LDLNGILHVSAKEKNTDLEKSIVIDNAISRFEEAEMEAAKNRIKEIFGEGGEDTVVIEHKAETDSHHAVVQARALVEKAERMLDDAAIAKEDFAALKEPMDQLSDILYYLES
jgi:molecular chaperone DnaK (HSP70)